MMTVSDPLLFSLSLVSLLASNLLVLLYQTHYNRHFVPFNRNIMTHLKTAIVHAFNLFISIRSVALLFKLSSLSEQLPGPAFAAVLRLGGIFTLLTMEGLLMAVAVTRLLLVVKFNWLHGQDPDKLAKKIVGGVIASVAILTVGLAALFAWLKSALSDPKALSRDQYFMSSTLVVANCCILVVYAVASRQLKQLQRKSTAISLGERGRLGQRGRPARTMTAFLTIILTVTVYCLSISPMAFLFSPSIFDIMYVVMLVLQVCVLFLYAMDAKVWRFFHQTLLPDVWRVFTVCSRRHHRIMPSAQAAQSAAAEVLPRARGTRVGPSDVTVITVSARVPTVLNAPLAAVHPGREQSDPASSSDSGHGPRREPIRPGDFDHGPRRDPICPGDSVHGPRRDPVQTGNSVHGPRRDPIRPTGHGPRRDPIHPGDSGHRPRRDPIRPGDSGHEPQHDPVHSGDSGHGPQRPRFKVGDLYIEEFLQYI